MTPTLLTLILHAAAIIGLAVGNVMLTMKVHRLRTEVRETRDQFRAPIYGDDSGWEGP